MKRPPRSHLFRAYVVRGQTIREIADYYGATYGTARRWLIYHGIPLRTRGAPVDEENHRRRAQEKSHRQRLRALAAARRAPRKPRTTDGAPPGPKPSVPPDVETLRVRSARMSLTALGQHYGRDPRTVKGWLERAGLPVPDGRRGNVPNAETLAEMRETMTLAEIGVHFNVSRQRVHQWLNS